jgi:uncharacterized protein YjiS (DUF1127 family)
MAIELAERRPVESTSAGARVATEGRSSPLLDIPRILSTWIRRSAQRRALRCLAQEPRLLSDIGLTRTQALREADKLFWRP